MSGKLFNTVSTEWVLDSGSSHHMTHNPQILQNLTKLPKPIFITSAMEETLLDEEFGTIAVASNLVLKMCYIHPNSPTILFLFAN